MIGSQLKQSVCLNRQQESKLVSGQFPLHCFLVKIFAFSKKRFSVKKIGVVKKFYFNSGHYAILPKHCKKFMFRPKKLLNTN